jgi:hypothetical protein
MGSRGPSACSAAIAGRRVLALRGRAQRGIGEDQRGAVAMAESPARSVRRWDGSVDAIVDGIVEVVFDAEPDQGGADHARLLEQLGRRLALAYHGRTTGPEHAGFLARDRAAVGAEPVLMVEVDRGHDRRVRVDQVHGIEPASQPDFQQHDVEPRALEQVERRQRAVFEVRQRRSVAGPVDALERAAQARRHRHPRPDPDALVVAAQMRRGICSPSGTPRPRISPPGTRPSSPCRWCPRP